LELKRFELNKFQNISICIINHVLVLSIVCGVNEVARYVVCVCRNVRVVTEICASSP
jgi:hypothetical protein